VPLAAVLDRFRTALAESDRGLALALEDATLVERSAQRLVLAVAEPFAARRLERRLADLEAAAERLFGHPLRLRIRTAEAPAAPRPPGAAAPRSDADEETARRRKREALDHPAVNAALEILGGDVVEIRPLGGGGPPAGGAR
jgi:hypothetical protein